MHIKQLLSLAIAFTLFASPAFASENDAQQKDPGAEQEMQHDMAGMQHQSMNKSEHDKMMQDMDMKHSKSSKKKTNEHEHSDTDGGDHAR